ncbi:hypothetical protein Clacol_000859 [Clathrus columnatus]|uniref:Uncharacterized protein n=1 Tax=Clathrus columnatus TaxID=1419009 RepID=A0AAV5A058_9AGAM|nr:hypothetical protein Clacol_000859 [Clathrus columnatus]
MIRSRYCAFVLLYLNPVIYSFILGYSDSEQCGSVMVTWRGQQTDTVDQFQFPFYLYIVPFNSTAAIRKIDNWRPSTTSGSAAFFDFPSLSPSTSYILGVVDSQGKGVGPSSQILTVHNSTTTNNSTFCLSSPHQLSQTTTTTPTLGIATSGSSQDCPSVSLAFQPNAQLPRALIFSPGERPSNMFKTSNIRGYGFVRASGFTSLSRAVVVFQSNDNASAFTSSLMTVGGSDSVNCENSDFTVPTALQGGTVIGYTLAAAFATALVTALLVYIHHLRRRASTGPCVPEKDLHVLIHRRRGGGQRPKSSFLRNEDRDLEAARLVPLPPSTTSLISTGYTSRRESSASAIIPNPPRPSPVTPVATPNVLLGEEGTVRPTSQHQSSELRPGSRLGSRPTARTSVCDHHHHHHHHHHHSQIINTSPTDYSIITGTRRPSCASYEVNSGRPSTYITGESVMLEESSFTNNTTRTNTTSQYIPRPDSPTLPEIPAPSPFNLSLRLERLSRGSSKKSSSVNNERRSMYLKMGDGGDGDVVVERGTSRTSLFALPPQLSSSRRSRSLGRTKSNSSRKSKKRRPSLPDVVMLDEV